jgi:hypothetical protein
MPTTDNKTDRGRVCRLGSPQLNPGECDGPADWDLVHYSQMHPKMVIFVQPCCRKHGERLVELATITGQISKPVLERHHD